MEDTSKGPPLSEHYIWVQGNLNTKGRVYGYGVEAVVITQQSYLSVSTRSSSINNYDARKMTTRLNESVSKAVEDAQEEKPVKRLRRMWWQSSLHNSTISGLRRKLHLKMSWLRK